MSENKIIIVIGIIVSTILGLIAIPDKIKAESETIYADEFIPNIYVRQVKTDGTSKFRQGRILRRRSDGQFVYCLQPFVEIDSGSSYQVIRNDFESVLGVTQEQVNRISLLAYYGYNYGSHTDSKWYFITQVMIWRTIEPTADIYFTDTLNGIRNDSLYINEINELESLVNSHYNRPNFNSLSETKLPLNQTISLNDSNNVLINYEVKSATNVNASISGNTLNITGTGVGSANVILEKKDKKFVVPPLVYVSPYSQNVMSIGAYDPVNVSFNLEVVGGKIKIKKVDSETKTTTPQGEASLIGAKYQVLNSNNKVVSELTISNDNTAITDYLPYGSYKIKEVQNSKGYLINNKIYNVDINSSNTFEIDVEEDVIKNYISILKQYDYVDGKTQFLNAESNINFEIYNSNNKLMKTISTDKNGYATIELPYGTYKFHQVNSTTGFEKIYDFYITINETSNKEQYYNILNNSLNAYLQVFKIDAETGNKIAIPDTTFKIFNLDTNKYVSQYVGGKVYSEYKTDQDGKFITYLKLESGNYKLIEISSPKGYVINNDGIEFTIGNDTYFNYTTYGAFVTIEYKNKPIKGKIEINKIGENIEINDGTYKYINNKKLKGVVYEVYADEDIKSSDNNYIYYNKDDLVDTITTDENGYAITKLLPLGKYKIIEVKTNDEYVLDNKIKHIELTEIDNKTEVVYKSIENINLLKKGKLEFTKTDLVNGEVIPNTIIKIYDDMDNLVYTGITDFKGQIIIDNLKVGKYYIIESKPATGYLLNKNKVYFEIKDNNEVAKANMTNKPITGTLEFTKLDFSTSEPLPNTLIEIYNSKDELIYSGRTNQDGKIVIENLTYGKYYILEKEAPTGYDLNKEKMYFEIKTDGEIVKSIMRDEAIIEVPDTFKNEFPLTKLTAIIIIGLGVGILIYVKKNK